MATQKPADSDIEKFKRRLIKVVARMMNEGHSLHDEELWITLKKQTKADYRTIWHRMRNLTWKKLRLLMNAGDRCCNVPCVARMSLTDWLLFDLVLVHEPIDMIASLSDSSGMDIPQVLWDLFDLVKKHQIEGVSGPRLVRAWVQITMEYNTGGRECSPMLLQLRWYLLKQKTRESFYNFWAKFAKYQKNQKEMENIKPNALYAAVARTFPSVVTGEFVQWKELIQNGLVVKPIQFQKKMKNYRNNFGDNIETKENLEATSGDVVLIEPQIETITLNDDDSDDEHEQNSHSQEAGQNHDDIQQLTEEEQTKTIEPADDIEILAEEEAEIEVDQQTLDLFCGEQYIVNSFDAYDIDQELIDKTPVFVPEHISEPIDGLSQVKIVTTAHVPEEDLVAHSKTADVHDITAGISDDTYTATNTDTKPKLPAEKPLTSGLDKDISLDSVIESVIKTEEPAVKEDFKTSDLNIVTLDILDDGIEFVDDGIAVNDSESGNDSDSDSSSTKIDHKLLLYPIVYTVKLDEMNALKGKHFDSIRSNILIEKITKEGKIQKPLRSMQNNKEKPEEINEDEYDDLITVLPIPEDVSEEDEISTEENTTTIDRVKITNNLFKKPKNRTYSPIQLCKNPDFNTRLKKLITGIVVYEKNKEQLLECKPLTIDLDKGFERKLVDNMVYLKDDELKNKSTRCVLKELSDKLTVTQNQTKPDESTEDSLLKLILQNDESIYNTAKPCDEQELLAIRKSKTINLPDIDHVRKLNQQLLTAQVPPIPAAKIQKDVTSEKQENPNISELVETLPEIKIKQENDKPTKPDTFKSVENELIQMEIATKDTLPDLESETFIETSKKPVLMSKATAHRPLAKNYTPSWCKPSYTNKPTEGLVTNDTLLKMLKYIHGEKFEDFSKFKLISEQEKTTSSQNKSRTTQSQEDDDIKRAKRNSYKQRFAHLKRQSKKLSGTKKPNKDSLRNSPEPEILRYKIQPSICSESKQNKSIIRKKTNKYLRKSAHHPKLSSFCCWIKEIEYRINLPDFNLDNVPHPCLYFDYGICNCCCREGFKKDISTDENVALSNKNSSQKPQNESYESVPAIKITIVSAPGYSANSTSKTITMHTNNHYENNLVPTETIAIQTDLSDEDVEMTTIQEQTKDATATLLKPTPNETLNILNTSSCLANITSKSSGFNTIVAPEVIGILTAEELNKLQQQKTTLTSPPPLILSVPAISTVQQDIVVKAKTIPIKCSKMFEDQKGVSLSTQKGTSCLISSSTKEIEEQFIPIVASKDSNVNVIGQNEIQSESQDDCIVLSDDDDKVSNKNTDISYSVPYVVINNDLANNTKVFTIPVPNEVIRPIIRAKESKTPEERLRYPHKPPIILSSNKSVLSYNRVIKYDENKEIPLNLGNNKVLLTTVVIPSHINNVNITPQTVNNDGFDINSTITAPLINLPKGVGIVLMPDNTLSISIEQGTTVSEAELAHMPTLLALIQRQLSKFHPCDISLPLPAIYPNVVSVITNEENNYFSKELNTSVSQNQNNSSETSEIRKNVDTSVKDAVPSLITCDRQSELTHSNDSFSEILTNNLGTSLKNPKIDNAETNVETSANNADGSLKACKPQSKQNESNEFSTFNEANDNVTIANSNVVPQDISIDKEIESVEKPNYSDQSHEEIGKNKKEILEKTCEPLMQKCEKEEENEKSMVNKQNAVQDNAIETIQSPIANQLQCNDSLSSDVVENNDPQKFLKVKDFASLNNSEKVTSKTNKSILSDLMEMSGISSEDTAPAMPQAPNVRQLELNPVFTVKALRYAYANEGQFHVLNLETGAIMPLKVSIKKTKKNKQLKNTNQVVNITNKIIPTSKRKARLEAKIDLMDSDAPVEEEYLMDSDEFDNDQKSKTPTLQNLLISNIESKKRRRRGFIPYETSSSLNNEIVTLSDENNINNEPNLGHQRKIVLRKINPKYTNIEGKKVRKIKLLKRIKNPNKATRNSGTLSNYYVNKFYDSGHKEYSSSDDEPLANIKIKKQKLDDVVVLVRKRPKSDCSSIKSKQIKPGGDNIDVNFEENIPYTINRIRCNSVELNDNCDITIAKETNKELEHNSEIKKRRPDENLEEHNSESKKRRPDENLDSHLGTDEEMDVVQEISSPHRETEYAANDDFILGA